ncbi:diadenylate cyclase [Priestia megaterium]|uniref:diadenylate cyclase n=1 Tax=Priestia megaterium TaxID=1404 RepID=UPI0035D6D9B5
MLWHNILDYVFIIAIILTLYRFIRKTEAVKMVLGIVLIYALSYIAGHLGFERTSFLLNLGTQTLAFGTLLIFSPELRMFLKKLGGFSGPKRPSNATLKVFEDALFELSKNKHGALIIMDENGDISAASENQTFLDAKVSSSLIGTIFHPNTPLHDGAVLIQKGRIHFAGCKLPLSARKRDNFGTLGTRHMVAIETAESFDTIVFVVSEETGAIRIATKSGLYFVASRQDFRQFFLEHYDSTLKKLK